MERKEVKVRSYSRRKGEKKDNPGGEVQVVAPDEGDGITKIDRPRGVSRMARRTSSPGVEIVGGGGQPSDIVRISQHGG